MKITPIIYLFIYNIYIFIVYILFPFLFSNSTFQT
jgi:hypothetical protein